MNFLPFLLLSILSSALLVHANSWAANDLPNPQTDPKGICGRGSLKSAVCDPDGNISPADADQIDGLINFINQGSHGFHKLPCSGRQPVGAQIAVVVVQRMAKSFGSSEQRAFQFAKDIHDSWGVGDPHCQNGIVLMFSIDDRAMGFSTGAGVKNVFKDSMIPSVMDSIKSQMRRQQYGPAIIDAVTSIGNILSGNVIVSEPKDSFMSSFALFPMFLFSLFFCYMPCTSSRPRSRYARCKKLLKKLDNDRAHADRDEYVATSCAICLEDFPTTSKPSSETDETNPSENPDTERLISDQPNPEADQQQDKIIVLPCGHKFHERCILNWMSQSSANSSQCPICRQPIADDTDLPPNLPSGWEAYEPEYDFRLRRMHEFYPDYVTLNMVNSWQRDRHSPNPIATSPEFVAVNPQVVAAAARQSGGGGSSFSFGGGSSGGGGGGGSSAGGGGGGGGW